jgi:carbon monoxide dehydrogenase subunit G
MIEISKSLEISAPIEKVWSIVGDLEHEQKYWSTLNNVKILGRKDESTVEREATIRRGPLGEAKSTQTLSVDSAKKISLLTLTKGPMLGTRKISLSSLEGGTKTRIDANWQFELKGAPGFAQGFVKDAVSEAPENALAAIAQDAQKLT